VEYDEDELEVFLRLESMPPVVTVIGVILLVAVYDITRMFY
jgi:hypothetical protein